MEQTAVEWLYNNLKSNFEHDGDLLEGVQFSFNQAKEMEKEQIIDAHNNGRNILPPNENGKQYYNVTFNK